MKEVKTQLYIPVLSNGIILYAKRQVEEWVIDYLIRQDIGVSIDGNELEWDSAYMNSDSHNVYKAGKKQEELLKKLNLI